MNGETFVIYTTQEGGLFKVTRASEGEYREAIDRGEWDETPSYFDGPRWTNPVGLAFIAFLRVEDNHDFVLGCSREDTAAIRRWESKRAMADMKSALITNA